MLQDYEKLVNSVLENGIKGNESITDTELASYIAGKLCQKIAEKIKPESKKDFSELDVLTFQETPKSPRIFSRTLEKMAVYGHFLDGKDKELFANLCADVSSLNKEMDGPAFLAGYMHDRSF